MIDTSRICSFNKYDFHIFRENFGSVPVLFPIRDKYTITGLIGNYFVRIFNFHLTIEKISIMAFFTPMKGHFFGVYNKAQLLAVMLEGFAFYAFKRLLPATVIEISGIANIVIKRIEKDRK